MDQQDVTLQPRRGHDALQEHEQAVGVGVIGEAVGEDRLFLEQDRGEGAIGLHRRLNIAALHPQRRAIAGDVVPDHLDAAAGNGEWHIGAEIHQAVAARDQIGLGRPLLDQRVFRVGQVGAAAGGIYRHLVGVGVAPKQRHLPRRELVSVLIDIRRGDGKQHFVICEGVHQTLTRDVACRQLGDPTLPGRDAAIGIAGALGAHGGQFVAAQASGLFRADLCQRQAAAQAQQGRKAGGHQCLVHAITPCYVRFRTRRKNSGRRNPGLSAHHSLHQRNSYRKYRRGRRSYSLR